MSKPVIYAWMFESSSGAGKYETLQYQDGSLSCDCPGWTRRVDSTGRRTCKHTRYVEMGQGSDYATKHGPVGGGLAPLPVTASPSAGAVAVKPTFKRKFV